LRVASQAEIGVGDDEHFAIDGTVRGVTGGAAFAQGFVFENHRPGLFTMTLSAAFIQAAHGQAVGRFGHVDAVRIVTLHAVHAAFDYGMTLREAEFGVRFEMALKASGGIFAGIENEFAATAAGLQMQTRRAMARFAAGLGGSREVG
jgi:hypothetical protein